MGSHLCRLCCPIYFSCPSYISYISYISYLSRPFRPSWPFCPFYETATWSSRIAIFYERCKAPTFTFPFSFRKRDAYSSSEVEYWEYSTCYSSLPPGWGWSATIHPSAYR